MIVGFGYLRFERKSGWFASYTKPRARDLPPLDRARAWPGPLGFRAVL